MDKDTIIGTILQEKIVAIIRLKEQSEVSKVLKSLISGGIRVLEITSNTPGFLEEIGKARMLHPTVLIGAGTVTNAAIAEEAIKAGAQFLVTPNTNIAVIRLAHKQEIPVLMGAFTPTEVCLAVENGADIVKLFPATSLGIDYFKAIREPLNKVNFFVVGGIGLNNVQEWMDAGACGVGLGGVLTKSYKESKNLESIKNTAHKFVTLIRN